MLHMCLRRMYILLLLKCSNISVRSIWPDFSLSPVFPFFFSFWLDDLLIVDNLVLKSSTIIVLSSDSPLRSVIVQLLSHVQLWDPMDCSTPGLPVLHHLLELAQTQVHWIGDAIQPSSPLSSPSPPVFCLSQHQGLFQWVGSSHQVAKLFKVMLIHVFHT